jgi:hypothetical protein
MIRHKEAKKVTGEPYLAHEILVVDDVARQGPGRGGEIQHALGVDERVLLVAIHDDRVGEAQEVRLGDGDGEDPPSLDDVEVAREGV